MPASHQYKRLLMLLVIVCTVMTLTACNDQMSQVLQEESRKVAGQQKKLMDNQPTPTLSYSNERANLIKRAQIFNDPNKISWIYLLSANGQVVGFYSVKGKVSNKSSYLVPDDQIVTYNGGYMVIQAPDIDGSYGTNGEGIFWFTADGEYKESTLDYFLSENPIKLNVQPIMMEVKAGGQ